MRLVKVGSETVSPDKSEYPVRAEVRVRFADTDAQGVVYNGTFFTYLEVGRVEFFRQMGFLKNRQFISTDFDPYVVENACRYKKPAFFDDVLDIYVKINSAGRSSVVFHYVIYSRERDELIAAAYTVLVFVDPTTKQPRTIPEDIKKHLLEAIPFESG